ncbi:hypothetical protein CDAR_175671 [Caerostris darwini]|uniref:Uncharacterized protein n=1 Tax=Caerostris darwini TaxID=1538125 RepID=A0AAV4X737_9ARAC|nr:hypothetical protein CDAR_175671 [Caerostris darwini]
MLPPSIDAKKKSRIRRRTKASSDWAIPTFTSSSRQPFAYLGRPLCRSQTRTLSVNIDIVPTGLNDSRLAMSFRSFQVCSIIHGTGHSKVLEKILLWK